MRISDWSSDVCSSDLSDRVRVPQLVTLYGSVRKKNVFKSNFLLNPFDLPEGLVNLKPLRKLVNAALPSDAVTALADGAVDLVVPTVNLQTAVLTLCTQERNQQPQVPQLIA